MVLIYACIQDKTINPPMTINRNMSDYNALNRIWAATSEYVPSAPSAFAQSDQNLILAVQGSLAPRYDEFYISKLKKVNYSS